jgi:hypothetical protein
MTIAEYLWISGAPIHNQRNEIIGGVLIFKDVSENKELALLNSLKKSTIINML